MATNLAQTVKQAFGNDFVQFEAENNSESIADINKFLDAGIPAVLASFFSYVNQSKSTSLTGLATEYLDSGFASKWDSATWKQALPGVTTRGKELSSTLLGSRLATLETALQNYSGLKIETSKNLLNIITPVALGVIGPALLANKNNLGAWMAENASIIKNVLPADFNVADKNAKVVGDGPIHADMKESELHQGSSSIVSNNAGAVAFESTTASGYRSVATLVYESEDTLSIDPKTYHFHSSIMEYLLMFLLVFSIFMGAYYFLHDFSMPIKQAIPFLPERMLN